ncbi:DEAD/DEAH box helicase [Actinocorallia sp. B10E7]|uniref:DEAD/DEAH box helicase n=1 Tax=Actinocorallia sp. B10E7 TaxID=3153558 RepID=UPI00325D7170
MFAVHGLWRDAGLYIWAEDSEAARVTTSRAKVRAHPFAVCDLGGVLAELGPEVCGSAAKAAQAELVLSLPSGARGPAASPELGGVIGKPRLSDWRVPALWFPADAALELLERAQPSEEVLLGTGLEYFGVVLGDVIGLLRRGRVLPTLVSEHDGYAARWRPVLAGADAHRFKELAAAMPPVCRADGSRSTHALIDAMASLTDAAVRRSSTVPFPLARGGRARVSFAERWLTALRGGDARVPDGPTAEVDELAAVLRDWFAVAHQAEGEYRLCLWLTEPEEGERWWIDFAVQSSSDLSLLVPAEEIWAGDSGLPGHADDLLLAGLGRAARLFPELDAALREARPTGLELDTEGAYRFLSEAAPLLRAAGFGVRLPAWAGRSSLGLKLTTRSAASSGGAAVASGFGLDDLVDFRWDLAVGDTVIEAEELAELARRKIPLVRLRGTWVELDDRQLAAALKFLKSGDVTGRMAAAQVVQEVVAGGVADLPLLEVDADGRLGDLLSGEAERRLAPLPTPDGFHGVLRPYQERGLAWLDFLGGLGLGAILADDMGLGKTAQALALMLARPEIRPNLVICPMTLVGNWQREAARFAPGLRVHVHHGAERDKDSVPDADLVITTYGTALRDQELLAGTTWARVLCDEAQTIKNSQTRQAKAVRSIPADARIALTGTPVENHLGELWSLMEFASPGLLGTRADFRRRFAVPIERDGDPDAAAALKRATRPFVLRRLKTDKTIISDLPDKMEMNVYCPLTPEQASLYQAVVEDMLARIEASEGIERRGLVLAAMTRLKQACNHPAHLLKDNSRLAGRSGKLTRLEELLAELLDEGDKALVFTQYAEFGTQLQPYLQARLGRPVLWLHGGTRRAEREALVERFSTDPEPSVFLLSLKAAGTGLNLTEANHVIHFDRWWNPAVENQATDRAFRIGQSKNVQVRKFVCTGTLEEKIDTMIERKRALSERIIGTGEEWLTELSTGELREIFELSAAPA